MDCEYPLCKKMEMEGMQMKHKYVKKRDLRFPSGDFFTL